MFLFRAVFVSIFVGVFVYLTQSLTRFSEMPVAVKAFFFVYVGVIIASVVAMPLFFWSENGRKVLQKYLCFANLAYYSLPLMSYLLFFVISRDVIGFIASFTEAEWLTPLYSTEISLGFIALSGILLLIGIIKVASGPKIFHQSIADTHVPTSFAGTTILQISDLHISHFLPERFLQKVLERAQREKPDMIVLTGDIVDGDLDALADQVDKLKSLSARLGVFYVPGNHEYYWAGGRIMQKLQSFGIKVLVNSAESVRGDDGEILVAGVPDPTGYRFGDEKPNWEKLKNFFKDHQFRVLLSHQPGLARQAAEVGFHLQFSGHTHAGQFFPWSLGSGLIHKFNRGYYFWKGMHVYVNQGTAYWGPAVRNFTDCEITVIKLNKKEHF